MSRGRSAVIVATDPYGIAFVSDVSRVSEMSLQMYLRTSVSVNDPSANEELGKSDLFLGNLMFVPDFETMVRGYSDHY